MSARRILWSSMGAILVVALATVTFASGGGVHRASPLWKLPFDKLPAAHVPFVFEEIVVFGDSLSDSGNLEQLLAIPAYPYYEGRFADGPNYVDVLAEEMNLLLAPSIGGGTNFAYGRARTGLHPHREQGALSGLEQVYAYLATELPTAETLFVVFLGGDNLRDGIGAVLMGLDDPNIIIPTVIGDAIADLAQILTVLVQAGAQTIMVPNMPNLGRIPEITQLPDPFASLASALATQATVSFNQALDQLLMAFGPAGIDIVQVNVFGLLEEVAENPAKFGLSNVDAPCYSGNDGGTGGDVCNNPDEYLFWDAIHPTARAHELLAEEVFEALFPRSRRRR